MATIRSTILCDFAQVREGLLFVSSGGITRLRLLGPGFPTQFYVAGQLEVAAHEQGATHGVELKVTSAISAIELWRAEMTVTTPAAETQQLFPGESTIVPFALMIGPFVAPEPGPHDLKVSVTGGETTMSTFYVLHPAAGPDEPSPAP